MESPESVGSSQVPSDCSPGNRKREGNTSSEVYVRDDKFGDRVQGRVPGTAIRTTTGLDIETYRVGGPELPMLPVDILDTPEHVRKEFAAHTCKHILEILKEHLPPPSKAGYPGICTLISRARPDAKPHLYVRVSIIESDSCQGNWIEAADAMRSKMKQLGLPHIKVLLAHPRAMVAPFSKPIPVDDPVLKTWPSVADKILEVVSMRKSWLTLDLLIRGKEWIGGSEKEKVKAVLLIRYDTQEDWNLPFLQKIRAAIDTDPLYQHRVELEVLRGYLGGGLTEMIHDDPPPVASLQGEDLFKKIPYMGASIGPDSYVGSGSFGCSIKLGDSPTVYGLTACHVALPTSGNSVSFADPAAQRHIPPELVDLLRTGAPLGTIPNAPVMKMPSKKDLEDLKDYYLNAMKKRKNFFATSFSWAVEMIEAGGPELEQQMKPVDVATYYQTLGKMKQLEASLLTVNDHLAAMDTPRCSLGPVRSFSGFRKDDNSGMILNWALFPYHSPDEGIKNRIPEHLTEHTSCFYAGLVGFSYPQRGEQVYKIGRTTGFTKGVINPPLSYVNHGHSIVQELQAPDTRVWPAAPGTEHQKVPQLSKASAICIVTEDESKSFAAPGDSGAVVFGDDGTMKGLLVAGDCSLHTAYMTPSTELVKDIKLLTGAQDVSFP